MATPLRRPHPGPVVLGLDTSGEDLALGLLGLPSDPAAGPSSWRTLEDLVAWRGRGHAEEVLAVVAQVLERHRLALADLALLAVARGPGSFTGVRVGMATVIGLALGLGKPAWPVSSLEALALHAAGSDRLALPLLDARRGEVYGALYEVDMGGAAREVLAPRAERAADLCRAAHEAAADRAVSVFGSGAVAYGCATNVPRWWHAPRGLATAQLAATAWEAAGRPATGPPLDPAYLRKSEAERNAEARDQGA